MRRGLSISDSDIEKIKESICSKIIVDKITYPHQESTLKTNESQNWVPKRYPMKVIVNNFYQFNEGQIKERLLTLSNLLGDYIVEDINDFIRRNNCQIIHFRGFYAGVDVAWNETPIIYPKQNAITHEEIGSMNKGKFIERGIHLNITARVTFLVDK